MSPTNWVNIGKKKRAILGFKNTIKNPDPKFPNKVLDILNFCWPDSESAKLELNIIYASQNKNTKPARLRKSIRKGIKVKVTLNCYCVQYLE